MDIQEFQNNLKRYNENIDRNFSRTLNDMINDLNPNVNINEYSKRYDTKTDADPFYYMKIKQLNKDSELDEFKNVIHQIAESNGSRYYKKLDYKIGIIADEFLYESFKDIADVEYISRDERNNLKEFDFVIFATTWRGIDGSWEGSANLTGEKRENLVEVIKSYNDKGIPTVFYSKEDPVNYNIFKGIATHCKYIYTTAQEVVDLYKEYTNNHNVNVLPFGVNPAIHNPVGSRSEYAKKTKDSILFAGSWLLKYPVRMAETKKMFDSIIREKAPFIIIDRNLEIKNPRYQFPSKYIDYITSPVEHEKLMKLHKIFRWSINLNSVKYSHTMFANRVYELQAFGNIVLSNYNTGINNFFPNVRMIHAPSDFNVIYNTDENDLRDLQAKGIRNVMSMHTTYERINQIASDIGLPTNEQTNDILVVLKQKSDENLKNFQRQIYNNATYIYEEELKNEIIKNYNYVTFFNDEFLYEEYYLEDMISAFKYTDVDFITKDNESEQHNYIDTVKDKYKTLFDCNSVKELDELFSLKNGYNLDDVEIISVNAAIKDDSVKVQKSLSVIVPIHNNGTYLEEKCFASLKRSSIFDQMEIIFVNDGSTDDRTIKIINRLRRRYPDIVYYEFEQGSGSASRPRNKGIELATTDLITYLDPDNEALGDGYKSMLDLMKKTGVDMVVGNIIKEDNSKKTNIKYADVIKKYNNGKLFISDPKNYLIRCGMRVQSIQALIIKKHIIADNNIKMVEGAAGQDTMFFQELILNCNSVQGINKFIHVYYAAVEGSVTNTISKKFFDKYYKLEIERIPYLNKYNLMHIYLKERFNFYIRKWYIPRLEQVDLAEREEAIKIFLRIIELYDEYSPEYEMDVQEYLDQLKVEIKSN